MDNTPIFWNTQGSITYDTEKNYFNYETSMSVNWNNKKARRVLITLMKLFNRPEILNVNTNGIAIWTYNNLKNNIFYKKPNIFYEIILRDMYHQNIDNYAFLTVSYKIDLEEEYINILGNYYNYINYDSNTNILQVKSRTLEENIIILDIFLKNKKIDNKKLHGIISNHLSLLNKKSEVSFMKEIQKRIIDINNKVKIIRLPQKKNKKDLENDYIEDVLTEDLVDSEEE